MLAEGIDHGISLKRKGLCLQLFWAGRQIRNGGALFHFATVCLLTPYYLKSAVGLA